jgi:hypothetical protein
MGSAYRTVADKLRLLQLAKRGSVTRACATMRFSRDSYYRLRALYKRRGKAGLKPMSRRHPLPNRRVAPAIEAAVVTLAREEPGWGQVRVAEELVRRRLQISASGVRWVWVRHGLTTRRLRGFHKRQPQAVRIIDVPTSPDRRDRRWTPQARAEVIQRRAERSGHEGHQPWWPKSVSTMRKAEAAVRAISTPAEQNRNKRAKSKRQK